MSPSCVCKIPAAAAAQSTPYCHPCRHPHPASQSAYDLLEGAVASLPPGPQHLVVLSGVPLIFPTVGRMHVLHLRAHDPTLLRHPASATFSAPACGSPVSGDAASNRAAHCLEPPATLTGAGSRGHSGDHSAHGTGHATLPPPRAPHRCGRGPGALFRTGLLSQTASCPCWVARIQAVRCF